MTIELIMSTRVVTVDMDDSLEVVHELFKKVKFHHLLVMDEGELAGIISDRDLFKSISPYVQTLSELPRDAATLKKKAHLIMTRHPIVVDVGVSLVDAITLFVAKGISCLPVLNKDKKVVGIITTKDILRMFVQNPSVVAGFEKALNQFDKL